MTLFYGNCAVASQSQSLVPIIEFDCTVTGNGATNNEAYYVSPDLRANTNIFLGKCEGSVIVAVFRSAVEALKSNYSLSIGEALDGGFGLRYQTANDTYCEQFVKSGGRCGFDSNSTMFTCFCPDQPRAFHCNSNGSTGNQPNSTNQPNFGNQPNSTNQPNTVTGSTRSRLKIIVGNII
ncbi:LEAF RUST 10 DISEASE-RESISTANCE LOCUS RECEPTOR-LIKE PROTEIN KINASE-like 2.1 [Cornus florida]|uniref:LEAF RUST 10 DISEASE-RESISTANCE LOCUS RECEPTOR-LIKE PROTEIN KINASE-like 2.1 n=1 Tax=Cornus florida TaxID=4283 RepID=UPI00289706CE|nr:LEAF RUST 10 DISEASE-RESISTANCE LOCUS RECEPTOR-LIKE PROTEIN KINASE-like 2.1 [Cornus florida]